MLITLVIVLVAVLALIIGAVVALLVPSGGGGKEPLSSPPVHFDETAVNMTNGYINVIECGADPTDNKDDSTAFRTAAASGKGIFIPAGEYHLSTMVELNGQDVVGEGMALTTIICDSAETMFRLSGTSRLSEVTLTYKSGEAARGEKTAVRLVGGSGSRSPMVANVTFRQVGTAVVVESGTTNGIRLEDLTVESFGYAAVVFDGAGHHGANLRSLYIKNSLPSATYAVEMKGDEGTLIEQVTLENCKLQQGVYFDGSVGFYVKTAQFLGTEATAMLGGRRAAGKIGSVFCYDATGETTGFTDVLGGSIIPEYTTEPELGRIVIGIQQ